MEQPKKKPDLQRIAKYLLFGGLGAFSVSRVLWYYARKWAPDTVLDDVAVWILTCSLAACLLCVAASAVVLLIDRSKRKRRTPSDSRNTPMPPCP